MVRLFIFESLIRSSGLGSSAVETFDLRPLAVVGTGSPIELPFDGGQGIKGHAGH